MGYLPNGLHLHYQPIFSSVSLKPVAVEALLRPQYIPSSDDGSLAKAVLAQALHDLPALQRELSTPDLKLQVNITAKDIACETVWNALMTFLRQMGTPAKYLILELTEHFGIEDIETTCKNMAQCAAHGVQIYLDDFGRGYSNLEWLIRLPVSGLKFDREMVANYRRKKNAALFKHLCALSADLGWTTTAEGIEHTADIPALRDFGFDKFQGYALCKPAALGKWDMAKNLQTDLGQSPQSNF